MIVSASILSADFGHLQKAVGSVPSADWLHLDVMDGHFVPNITFGPVVADALRTSKPLDVHLMVEKPERFVPWFKDSSYITFHVEATTKPLQVVKAIKAAGAKAGISIRPATPVAKIEPYLKSLDLVLVMAVEPGFPGQKFMDSALEKIRQLKEHRENHKLRFLISVDGGINDQTAKLARQAGADVLIAASYIFSSPEPEATIKKLKGIQ